MHDDAMIPRLVAQKILELSHGYPALAIAGPRQSGKTTLARALFPDKPHLSLENPDTRRYAEEDPRSFLKTPKLYFFDTGLATWLLGIQAAAQVETHPLRGALFETLIITEMIKARAHRGLPSNLYFWRDRESHEVDVVVDEAGLLLPVEIKSGATLSSDWYNSSATLPHCRHRTRLAPI